MDNTIKAEESTHALEIHKMFVGTFNTDIGAKCLERLKDVYIDRPVYVTGMTLDQTAYRQGQADIVKSIMREVNRNGR